MKFKNLIKSPGFILITISGIIVVGLSMYFMKQPAVEESTEQTQSDSMSNSTEIVQPSNDESVEDLNTKIKKVYKEHNKNEEYLNQNEITQIALYKNKIREKLGISTLQGQGLFVDITQGTTPSERTPDGSLWGRLEFQNSNSFRYNNFILKFEVIDQKTGEDYGTLKYVVEGGLPANMPYQQVALEVTKSTNAPESDNIDFLLESFEH